MEKIVIIGGGIAGLSAGIYARLSGFETEIYEKNSVPGGECTGWNREGYHIDNCIHWLTGTRKDTELYEVWSKVGALSEATKYAKVDTFFSSSLGGERVTLWKDLEKTREEMIKLSKEDEEEINRFIYYIECAKQCLYPAKKPLDMMSVKEYIEMGVSMADFAKMSKEIGKISLKDYSRRFKHPLLRKLMCDYLPSDYCAYSFFVSYATIADGNGDIPLGASLGLALRMEKKYKELGGKIYYNSSAESIELRNKTAAGITLDDGSFIEADYIIPAIDMNILFTKLLSEKYMPRQLRIAYRNQDKYPTTSGFQAAFSVPLSSGFYETAFDDIEPISIGSRTYDRMYIKAYDYDELYIKDGRCVLQTCISQSDEDFLYWKSLSHEEYKRAKNEAAQEVMKRIAAKNPLAAGQLKLLDVWTPLTYERYCGAYHGSYMSFVTTPFGRQIRLKGKVRNIKNIYLAGQWTNSPGGLPVAVTSGKFAIQRLLKDCKRNTENDIFDHK